MRLVAKIRFHPASVKRGTPNSPQPRLLEKIRRRGGVASVVSPRSWFPATISCSPSASRTSRCRSVLLFPRHCPGNWAGGHLVGYPERNGHPRVVVRENSFFPKPFDFLPTFLDLELGFGRSPRWVPENWMGRVILAPLVEEPTSPSWEPGRGQPRLPRRCLRRYWSLPNWKRCLPGCHR